MSFSQLTEQELKELMLLKKHQSLEPLVESEANILLEQQQFKGNPFLIRQNQMLQDEMQNIKLAIKTENIDDDEQNQTIHDDLLKIKEALQEKQKQEKQQNPFNIKGLKTLKKDELFTLAFQRGYEGNFNKSTRQTLINYLLQFDPTGKYKEEPEKKELFKELSIQAGNKPFSESESEEESGYTPDFEREPQSTKSGDGLSEIPKSIEKDADAFSKMIKKGLSTQKEMKKFLKLAQRLITFNIMTQKEFEQIVSKFSK